ncbi:MAG: leucine-rich repeat domain-containing protein [Lachnospiraceae bacterium]|nr:leucine-rich repeat domain-containing protein [Lachnospiraceae bacterium]
MAAYKHILSQLGCRIAASDTASMLASDGAFIFLCGEGHGRVRDDLNMLLNKGIPVAYAAAENAVIDDGLKMQTGLATCIEKDTDVRQLREWVGTLEQGRRQKTKRRRTVIALIAAGLILAGVVAVVLFTGGFKDLFGHDTDIADNGETVNYLQGIDITEAVSLDLSGKGISDIAFLKNAANLEELDLSNNEITDIGPIKGLVDLKILNLSGNHISDLTPLAQLEKLEELDLSDNDIDYINPLLTLKNLKKLDISGNKIDDKAAFEFMDRVEIVQ